SSLRLFLGVGNRRHQRVEGVGERVKLAAGTRQRQLYTAALGSSGGRERRGQTADRLGQHPREPEAGDERERRGTGGNRAEIANRRACRRLRRLVNRAERVKTG